MGHAKTILASLATVRDAQKESPAARAIREYFTAAQTDRTSTADVRTASTPASTPTVSVPGVVLDVVRELLVLAHALNGGHVQGRNPYTWHAIRAANELLTGSPVGEDFPIQTAVARLAKSNGKFPVTDESKD